MNKDVIGEVCCKTGYVMLNAHISSSLLFSSFSFAAFHIKSRKYYKLDK